MFHIINYKIKKETEKEKEKKTETKMEGKIKENNTTAHKENYS